MKILAGERLKAEDNDHQPFTLSRFNHIVLTLHLKQICWVVSESFHQVSSNNIQLSLIFAYKTESIKQLADFRCALFERCADNGEILDSKCLKLKLEVA